MEKYDLATLISMLQQIKKTHELEWEEYKALSEAIGLLATMQTQADDLKGFLELP